MYCKVKPYLHINRATEFRKNNLIDYKNERNAPEYFNI